MDHFDFLIFFFFFFWAGGGGVYSFFVCPRLYVLSEEISTQRN